MRKLWLALLMIAALGMPASGLAQSVYDDDEDGPYDDESWPTVPQATPQPPPSLPAPSQSPYELLADGEAPATAPQAEQQEWRYNGPHAIHADYGSGWCNVQGPHNHPYPPFDDHLFQEDQGGYDFLGDPTDFGYTGDAYWFYDAHPIAAGFGLGWCFMPWPHRHIYGPFGAYFSACGSYWCYGGPYDSWYWAWRPHWRRYWTHSYPPYYRGGRYYDSRRSASPGRFGRLAPGRTVPAGRPGGVARPLPRPGAPLAGRPTQLGRRGFAAPRAMPRPYVAPRMRAAPSPSMPRTYSVPRQTAPRLGSPSYGAGPSFSAPRYSAPRPTAAPSRPSGGGFHGGGFHGGGFRGGGGGRGGGGHRR